MKPVRTPVIVASVTFLAGLYLTPDGAPAAGSPAPHELSTPLENGILSVGSIHLAPKEEVARFQPLTGYLAARLTTAGIREGRVVVARSMAEMAILMLKKEVDIYIDSPFPVAVVGMKSGAQPFLRRWKSGRAAYHSLIFARKDSGIATVQDLRGKMVALKNPFSTSGYLLPKATLIQAGMTLTQYTDASAKVPPNEIGYVFANSDENIMVWVLRGKVPVGAMMEEDFEPLGKDRRGDLKILLRTIDVPRHVVAHRANLPPKLVAMIEEVLLTMDRDDEGRRVLEHFDKTTKFDRFPQGAAQAFGPIEALTRLVEREVGR